MRKKVLIIGNLGYLGSRLSEYLMEFGYEVAGADTGYFMNGVIHPTKDPKTQIMSATNFTAKHLDGFDAVIQLAGISNDPVGSLDPETFYKPSVLYSLKIASLCRELGIQYIFPSSCSVYGISDTKQNEESQVAPQTHYSKNKIEIEEGLKQLVTDDFNPIALRLATIFGPSPRIRFDVVINMLVGMAASRGEILLNSNGLAWRPHLYIDDACEAFRCCLEKKLTGGELAVLNVGMDQNNWRILDVANHISSIFDDVPVAFLKDVNRNDDLIVDRKVTDGVDVRNYQVSFDKISDFLPNFKCRYTIEKGVGELKEWLQKYRVDATKFSQRDFYRLQQMEFLHSIDQMQS